MDKELMTIEQYEERARIRITTNDELVERLSELAYDEVPGPELRDAINTFMMKRENARWCRANIWTTSAGRPHFVAHMSTSHLVNTLRMVHDSRAMVDELYGPRESWAVHLKMVDTLQWRNDLAPLIRAALDDDDKAPDELLSWLRLGVMLVPEEATTFLYKRKRLAYVAIAAAMSDVDLRVPGK